MSTQKTVHMQTLTKPAYQGYRLLTPDELLHVGGGDSPGDTSGDTYGGGALDYYAESYGANTSAGIAQWSWSCDGSN